MDYGAPMKTMIATAIASPLVADLAISKTANRRRQFARNCRQIQFRQEASSQVVRPETAGIGSGAQCRARYDSESARSSGPVGERSAR